MTDKYANMKPIMNEKRYIEFDEEFECYSIFGDKSGFCYAQYSNKKSAEEAILAENLK